MGSGLKNIVCVFLIFFVIYLTGICQIVELNQALFESLIEDLIDEDKESAYYDQIYEDLTKLAEYPVNINTADREELGRLFFLDENQISEIIEYRNKYGKFISPAELLIITDFPENILREIMVFIKLRDEKNATSGFRETLYKKSVHEIIFRANRVLEVKKAYSDSIYSGDPWKYYLKYRYKNKKTLNIGITAEKDPGEEFFVGSNKYGFDFYSGFLEFNSGGFVKKLIIGDYICQFGQGTTLWKGFTSGKNSGSVINLKRREGGIKSSSSSAENGFFRGAGISLKIYKFQINTFISYRKIDAKIETISDSLSLDQNIIKTLYRTGFHRTLKEINHRNEASVFSTGANLKYYGDIFSIGITYAYQIYDKKLFKETKPYTVNHFNKTKSLYSTGVNYQAILKKYTIFGELSYSKGGGWAMLNGIIFNLYPGLNFSLLNRWYSPDYQAEFSGSISEGNSTSNEYGIYYGIEYIPSNKFKISGYCDNFKFPWLKYLANAPSSGSEYYISLERFFNDNFSFLSQYKSEIKGKNSTEIFPGLKGVNLLLKRSFRNQLNINISYNELLLIIRNRIEFSYYKSYKEDLEKGWLFYQDILVRPVNNPVSFSFRYAIFNTDSYNTRIYTYEHDVLYSFSVPSFYNKGCRINICIKYKVSRNFELWFRYNNTYYAGKDIIGSGSEEISGNNRSEVKFQLRLRL